MKGVMQGEKEKEEQRDKEAPQDFRMRYQIAIDDIKYLKNRQWAVTYYLLLIYAAIISLYHLADRPDCPWLEKGLALIAVLVAALGTYFLVDFQSRISTYRKHRKFIIEKKKLSNDFISFEENEIGDLDEYISWWRNFPTFTLSFMIMLWLGAFFVLWYLKIIGNIKMDPILPKIANSLGYAFIVLGSVGMISFAIKVKMIPPVD